MNARRDVLIRSFGVGLAVWVAVFLILALAAPMDAWVRDYHAWPGLLGIVTTIAVLAAVFTPLPRVGQHLLLTAIVGAYHLLTRVQPLGDYTKWIHTAEGNLAALSDLLANVIYRGAHLLGGATALEFVAPVCGVWFTFLFLRVADRLCARENDIVSRRFADLSCLAGSQVLLYGRGYVENTQLSLPFVLLAVLPLCDYRIAKNPRRKILTATLWLSIGAAVHGQVIALLPAVPFVLWLAAGERTPKQRLIDFAFAAALCAATLGAAVGVTWLLGFYVHFGHIHPLLFVPWSPHPLSRYALLELTHLRFVGNLLWLASPLVAAAPLMLLTPSRRKRWLDALREAPALLVLALGYCGYTFFVLFALQFPRDFDLALSLGIVVHLFVLRQICATGAARSVIAWIVLVVGALLASLVTTSLRIDPGVEAELRVNGRATDTVEVRPDERVVIEVTGRDEEFRVLGRVPGSSTPIELGEGRGPWISKSLDLTKHGRELVVELRWQTGESSSIRLVQRVPGSE